MGGYYPGLSIYSGPLMQKLEDCLTGKITQLTFFVDDYEHFNVHLEKITVENIMKVNNHYVILGYNQFNKKLKIDYYPTSRHLSTFIFTD